MAINFPGPYEVEFPYNVPLSGVSVGHVLRVNCAAVGTPAPGTPASSVNLQTIAGTPATLQACADGLWDRIRIFLNTTATSLPFILWKYTPGTFAKTFITSGTLTNPNGSSSNPNLAAHYLKMTFRSASGGIMGVMVSEDAQGGDTQIPLAANPAGNGYEQFAAYVISSAGWMLARDDSFPLVPYRLSFGENEAIWKKRFR